MYPIGYLSFHCFPCVFGFPFNSEDWSNRLEHLILLMIFDVDGIQKYGQSWDPSLLWWCGLFLAASLPVTSIAIDSDSDGCSQASWPRTTWCYHVLRSKKAVGFKFPLSSMFSTTCWLLSCHTVPRRLSFVGFCRLLVGLHLLHAVYDVFCDPMWGVNMLWFVYQHVFVWFVCFLVFVFHECHE